MELNTQIPSRKLTHLKDLTARTTIGSKSSGRRLTYEFVLDQTDFKDYDEADKVFFAPQDDIQKLTPQFPKKRQSKAQKLKSKQKDFVQSPLPNSSDLPNQSKSILFEQLSLKISPFVYTPSFKLTKDDRIAPFGGPLGDRVRVSDLFQEDGQDTQEQGGKVLDKSLDIESVNQQVGLSPSF